MKLTTLLLIVFALACCARAPSPSAASRDSKQGSTPKAVERPDPNHRFLVQPVVAAPQAVINAEGQTVIHADPSVLFKGTELDSGIKVRVDEPGSIDLLKPEFRRKPGVPIEGSGRFGLDGADRR